MIVFFLNKKQILRTSPMEHVPLNSKNKKRDVEYSASRFLFVNKGYKRILLPMRNTDIPVCTSHSTGRNVCFTHQ